jgi:hypothetical protein
MPARYCAIASPPVAVRSAEPGWPRRNGVRKRLVYCRTAPAPALPSTTVVTAAYDANAFPCRPPASTAPPTSTGTLKPTAVGPFTTSPTAAAVSEVEVDGFTGTFKLRQVDIVHDVGSSLNPLVDQGQVEGAFVQGMGWLTMEELVWDKEGRLRTYAPSTYKIPTVSEVPEAFHLPCWSGPPRMAPSTAAKRWGNRRLCWRSRCGKRFALRWRPLGISRLRAPGVSGDAGSDPVGDRSSESCHLSGTTCGSGALDGLGRASAKSGARRSWP